MVSACSDRGQAPVVHRWARCRDRMSTRAVARRLGGGRSSPRRHCWPAVSVVASSSGSIRRLGSALGSGRRSPGVSTDLALEARCRYRRSVRCRCRAHPTFRSTGRAGCPLLPVGRNRRRRRLAPRVRPLAAFVGSGAGAGRCREARVRGALAMASEEHSSASALDSRTGSDQPRSLWWGCSRLGVLRPPLSSDLSARRRLPR